ncbi:MAG: ATPase domain-containing protein [Giesbergeria sp.]
MTNKVTINRLATGVPGLDVVLAGGLPEFSFNLIAGPPGCGKTTLAHQIDVRAGHARTAGACISPSWASHR